MNVSKVILQHLARSEDIVNKAKTDDEYATNLYRALCNHVFYFDGAEWSCTWREAAGIVHDLVFGPAEHDSWGYLVYLCKGDEGFIAEDLVKDIQALGWNWRSTPLDECKRVPKRPRNSPQYSPNSPTK
jgi:hypothetical protein